MKNKEERHGTKEEKTKEQKQREIDLMNYAALCRGEKLKNLVRINKSKPMHTDGVVSMRSEN